MAGVNLIPADEMARRLQCAVAARGDGDPVVIGRTGALAASGVEEAIRRGNACRRAGADVILCDAVKGISQARAIARGIDGPLMISVIEGNETTRLTADELKHVGFSLVVYALSALLNATRAMKEVLGELQDRGPPLRDWTG